MTHGMSGGPALNEKGQVVGVNQGHLNCRGASSKQNPAHTGPSKYIPVNKAKEFLSRKLKLGSKGYEIIT